MLHKRVDKYCGLQTRIDTVHFEEDSEVLSEKFCAYLDKSLGEPDNDDMKEDLPVKEL